MNTPQDLSEFERRTRSALRNSAEQLDATMQSKLTQARHAALAQHAPRKAWPTLRYLAPLGAVAASLLVAVLFLANPRSSEVNPPVGGALDDLELLADAEGFAMTEETDLEFLEWATAQSAEVGS